MAVPGGTDIEEKASVDVGAPGCFHFGRLRPGVSSGAAAGPPGRFPRGALQSGGNTGSRRGFRLR
jgi:hypothetical protein